MADENDLGGAGSTDPSTQSEPQMAPDTEAGKAGMPDDPNAPPDAGVKSELTPQGQVDEYTRQLQEQHKKNVEAEARWHADQQKHIDYFQKRSQEMTSMQPPTQQMPPATPEQKNDVTHTIFQVLAAAAIAYTVFGRHGGAGQGAMMSGLGALLNGYSQGRADKIKQDAANFHQLNAGIMARNKEITQEYKDIIANKKLDLQQQLQLIHLNAAQHKDEVLAGKAKENDLKGVIKNIVDKDKAQANVRTRLTKQLLPKNSRSMAWQSYRMEVLKRSGGTVDVDRSDEELAKGEDYYKWDDFTADQMKAAEKKHADERASDAQAKAGAKSKGGVDKGGTNTTNDSDPLDLGLIKPKTSDAPRTRSTLDQSGDEDTPGKSVLGRDATGSW